MRRRVTMLVLALAEIACDREARILEPPPVPEMVADPVPMTSLRPGEPTPPPTPVHFEAGESAWFIAEGKALYTAFNCNGCHAHGGGDMGPPLMDARWRYGSHPVNIYDTIVEGRPNGMPSFAGKIAEADLWKLVAYVRSMSGLARFDALAGRSDDKHAVPPPPSMDPSPPRPEPVRHP